MNETCATGKITLPNIVSSQEQLPSSTSPSHPQNMSHVTSSPGMPISQVTHCMVFRYMEHREVKRTDKDSDDVTYETSVFANYSCDYNHICKQGITGWEYKVTYLGSQGDVYCCDKDNCNVHVAGVPPQQQLCYEGSNETDTPVVNLMSCTAPGAFCARATSRTANGRKMFHYFCDNFLRCQTNNFSPGDSKCKQIHIALTNRSEELCCCSKSRCYIPPWYESKVSTTPNPSPSSNSNTVVRWIVASVVVVATFLIGLCVGVTIAVVRHRRKARGDNHVAMTYRRISAADARSADVDSLIT